MTYYLVKNYGIIGGSISILFYFIIGNLYFLPIVAKECLNLELSSIFFLHFKVLKDLCLYFSPMFIYCYNVKTSFIEEVLIFTIIILIYYYINIRTLDENSKKNLRMFIKRIFQ